MFDKYVGVDWINNMINIMTKLPEEIMVPASQRLPETIPYSTNYQVLISGEIPKTSKREHPLYGFLVNNKGVILKRYETPPQKYPETVEVDFNKPVVKRMSPADLPEAVVKAVHDEAPEAKIEFATKLG